MRGVGDLVCRVGEVDVCFRVHGDDRDPVVLLVMGLGLGLVAWREDFVDALVARGLRVVRYDNRDVGRSSALAGPGVGAWGFLTRRVRPAYSLGDMADDGAGLLAALGVRAHVVGVSMGAMVAQELAIRHPDRVLSLVSIMGRPGDRRSGRVAWSQRGGFLRPAPAGREAYVEHGVRAFRRIGSPGRTAADDEDVREATRRALERDRDPAGAGRQLAAVIGERDRTADLGRLATPVTVLHGARDRVVLPSGGRATAAAVGEAARYVEVPDMGHDLARCHWDLVVDEIAGTVARGEAAR